MGMATKNIAITEKAYSRLNSLKTGKESFSEVINRVTERRNLNKFIGILSRDSADKLENNIKELRAKHNKEFEKRIRNMRSKLN
jgi:predicted CopG family antitoxin